MTAGPQRWPVPPEAAGQRLDRALAEHLREPRSQIQRWIEAGRVAVDGKPARPSALLKVGQIVSFDPPPREERDPRVEPEPGELPVLYEDPHLVVVNKPAGISVHPGAGRARGTLAHRLLAHYPEMAGIGGPGRPGLIHRLDLGTSGVIAVARSAAAYQNLHRAFSTRAVEKSYLALAYGRPKAFEGRIDAPIGRHPERRTEMAVRPGGRPAVTLYRHLAESQGVSLFLLTLVTGRTHQIRVHLKYLGHPLVGDPVYGEARFNAAPKPLRKLLEQFPRPALHAWRLSFRHPETGAALYFEAPAPEDLVELWRAISGSELASLLSPKS